MNDTRKLSPLITAAGMKLLRRLREHPAAPIWNHAAGDRLTRNDIRLLNKFKSELNRKRQLFKRRTVPKPILQTIAALRSQVPSFRRRLTDTQALTDDFESIPTMCREDIARRVEQQVPDNAILDDLIVYRTAGTTGHSILIPHHPRAAAAYQALLSYALKRYGIRLNLDSKTVAGFLVGCQAHTVTYPTVLSFWNHAGFAKLNLHPAQWRSIDDPATFFSDCNPLILTGDPISFAEMMKRDIPARPKAMFSTAVAMSRGLKQKLSGHYGCPVIDWYSLTETGPIGYACKRGNGFHVLSHDIFLETIDANGQRVKPGQRGEITVTGGRNPFLPLLRYRTGDFGRLDFRVCSCGDPMPRIMDLEGRKPVIFQDADQAPVNPVDISRILRDFPLVQHEFRQNKDRSCRLVIRPISEHHAIDDQAIAAALQKILGAVKISITTDNKLGDRKVIPYKSAFLLED